MNLWLHAHRQGQPWVAAENTVVDSYRLIGEQVIVFEGDVGMLGRLVAVDDHRVATLLPPGGDPVELRATRIEPVAA